jgi:hypothetical protein
VGGYLLSSPISTSGGFRNQGKVSRGEGLHNGRNRSKDRRGFYTTALGDQEETIVISSSKGFISAFLDAEEHRGYSWKRRTMTVSNCPGVYR